MLPLNYVIKLIGMVAKKIVKDIDKIRAFVSQLREKIMRIIQDTFGVLLNILISFQKILIVMRDMVNKIIGIFVTLMYIMQGAMFTMQSMWAGINGQMVRSMKK